jgi:hypothetical protein
MEVEERSKCRIWQAAKSLFFSPVDFDFKKSFAERLGRKNFVFCSRQIDNR